MSSGDEGRRTIELISSDDETDQIKSLSSTLPPNVPLNSTRKGNENTQKLTPKSKRKEKQSTLKVSGSSERLTPALSRVFKFDQFRSSLQEEACRAVLQGESDVFVCMPTGAG